MKVDLHLHSNYSDGSDSIVELANQIRKNDIKIVALTDHDTTDGVFELEKNLDGDIQIIRGVELTCLAGDIKCHILGYYIEPENKYLVDLISKGKILRRKKLETRINFLKDKWGIELTKTEKDWLYSRTTVVKIHLANILVNRGLAGDNLSAMSKYLDGCKTGNTRFDGEEAIEVIKKSGGIPIWAHPIGGEAEIHISKELFLDRLKKMKNFGIEGIECYYSRYSKSEVDFLAGTAKENDLYISGGSDYHGKNKSVPIAKLNTENIYIDSSELTVIKNKIILNN